MKLLLDTHALLWWLADAPELAPAAREAIADPANLVSVSAASVWEISIKTALGKLDLPDDWYRYLCDESFERLDLSWEHAHAAGLLPDIHRDPFDRMLVAQAQAEGLTIVTRDRQIGLYGVPVLPA